MKSRAILLLLGLMISGSFAFGQVPKDTLQKDSMNPCIITSKTIIWGHKLKDAMKKDSMRLRILVNNGIIMGEMSKDTILNDSIYPKVYRYFFSDRGWQIQKEAYKKQLETMGLSEKELNRRMQEFDKQKAVLMKGMTVQMKAVEKQLQLSGLQRKITEEELQKFEKQWSSGEFQKQMAEAERQESEGLRKFGEEFSTSTRSILNKNITLSANDSRTKTVRLRVTKSNTLFINVSSEISSGHVLIEIFNPKGKNRGEISLAHRNGSSPKTWAVFSDNTSGSVNNIINAPETGVWLVKISPKRSKGHIQISVAQYNNPAN